VTADALRLPAAGCATLVTRVARPQARAYRRHRHERV